MIKGITAVPDVLMAAADREKDPELKAVLQGLVKQLSLLPRKEEPNGLWEKHSDWIKFAFVLVTAICSGVLTGFIWTHDLSLRLQRIETNQAQLLRDLDKHEASDGHPRNAAHIQALQSELRLVDRTAARAAAMEPTMQEILQRVKVIEARISHKEDYTNPGR